MEASCGVRAIGVVVIDTREKASKDTRIPSARRHTPPPRVGLVGMQFDCQFSSATVTNPGLNPVETNAKLQR
jgi:hypothetical protein